MLKIILFRGRAGIGKTTISDIFSEENNFTTFRKDDIYDSCATLVTNHNDINSICYNFLINFLLTNKNKDLTLVLDYPFNFKNQIEDFRDWCINNQIELISVLITCSDLNIWKHNFEKRKQNPKPNNKILDFDKLIEHYNKEDLFILPNEIVFDNVGDLNNVTHVLNEKIFTK